MAGENESAYLRALTDSVCDSTRCARWTCAGPLSISGGSERPELAADSIGLPRQSAKNLFLAVLCVVLLDQLVQRCKFDQRRKRRQAELVEHARLVGAHRFIREPEARRDALVAHAAREILE